MGTAIWKLIFLLAFGSIYSAAVFFLWLMRGCRTALDEEFSQEYKKRNMMAAILLTICMIAAIIYVNKSNGSQW